MGRWVHIDDTELLLFLHLKLWTTFSACLGLLQSLVEMEKAIIKNAFSQHFPVVQWLGTHLARLGTPVWSLVWENPTHCGATKPISPNYWAHVLPLLTSVCLVFCTPQQEKPPQWEARTPRKSPCAAMKTHHSPPTEKKDASPRGNTLVKMCCVMMCSSLINLRTIFHVWFWELMGIRGIAGFLLFIHSNRNKVLFRVSVQQPKNYIYSFSCS